MGHLVKTHSDLSWQGLMLTSFASLVLFTCVLCESLYGGSLAEKMLHHYQEVIFILQSEVAGTNSAAPATLATSPAADMGGQQQPITNNLNYFPPTKTVALIILKMTGKWLSF